MVFLRPAGVGRHDLTPQNSTLFHRVKSDAALSERENPYFWTDTTYGFDLQFQ